MNEKLDVLDSAKVLDNLLNHDQPLQLLERPKYRAGVVFIQGWWFSENVSWIDWCGPITANEIEFIISFDSYVYLRNKYARASQEIAYVPFNPRI